MYARHGRADSVRRRPRRLEQVEADFASLEVHVWVTDGRDEAHRGRRQRVLRGDVDVEEPASPCVLLVVRWKARGEVKWNARLVNSAMRSVVRWDME